MCIVVPGEDDRSFVDDVADVVRRHVHGQRVEHPLHADVVLETVAILHETPRHCGHISRA